MGRTAKGWSLVPRRGVQHVRFTWAKKRYELSTGQRDEGLAAPEAGRIYAEVISGKYKPALAGARALLVDVVADWIDAKRSELDEETVATYASYSVRWLKHFGPTIGSITRATAADWRRVRLLEVSASSVRKELSAMRGLVAFALEQGLIAEVPMIDGVGKKATGRRVRAKRPHYDITPDQVDTLLSAIPPRLRGGHAGRARFILAYETGLRPATLDGLSCPENYTKGGTHLQIPDELDKARFGRPLPLTARAREALDAVIVGDGPIFGVHDYRETWSNALEAAGLPNTIVPYDLRHARIQHLLDAGEPMTGVAYLVGHTLLTTTNAYVKASRRQAEKMVSGVKTGVRALDPVVRRKGLEPLQELPHWNLNAEPADAKSVVSPTKVRRKAPSRARRPGSTGVMTPVQFQEATANLLALMAGVQ